jgi:hypothetical protein
VRKREIILVQRTFRLKKPVHRLLSLALAVLLASASLGVVAFGRSDAAQITLRSLAISSGVPGATGVTYTYSFTLPTSGNVQSIQFHACTTPVGNCVAPTGQNINLGSQQGTNGFTSTTAFARDVSGANTCTPANNTLCVNRTQATAETGAKTLAWNTQTNPTTANSTFYVRMTTYSDTAWLTAVDTGTVAAAVVQSLTVSARVAEILQFCVGSTTVDDDTSSIATDCSGVSGTSVNIGTLDPATVNISPVATNGGDSKNAVAMLRTNAENGATVAYRAIQAGSGSNHLGTLRISGVTCNAGSVNTDGCINTSSTQAVFSGGTESFGMTIAGVNCGSATSYTCVYASGSNDLAPQSGYIGKGNGTINSYCVTCDTADSGNGYAWQESGSAVTIASSASSTIKQVDDEALVLKFAATPTITTPFGSYSVQADFIATPTF